MSKMLRFKFESVLSLSEPVRDHSFRLCCLPGSFPGQEIKDLRLSVSPDCSPSLQKDGFGNMVAAGYISAPHAELIYVSEGTVIVNSSLRCPEWINPVYKLQSRLTKASPEIKSLASKAKETDREALIAELLALANKSISYIPHITRTSTTAAEALSLGAGVCQDYAHIFISLCREMGIPARYCWGLVPGEGESHAWAEAEVNGAWTGFDPTRGTACDDSYIRIGAGRDFSDCPVEIGLFSGRAIQECSASAIVTELKY